LRIDEDDIMNLKTTTFSLVLAVASGGAIAQSAKFAASHNPAAIVANSDLAGYWEGGFSSAYATCLAEYGAGADAVCSQLVENPAATANLATIHVAQSKELLVGLSAEVALFTETTVRGKKGSVSTAMASADGKVGLMACNLSTDTCVQSTPAMVTLSSRRQELEATLGGVLESCTVELVDNDDDGIPDVGQFDAEDCEFSQEEIRLALATLASHHYNFMFMNLDQGLYEVQANFYTTAQVAASASCGESDGSDSYAACEADALLEVVASGEATATAVIGNSMMTVQEVRAVKGEVIEM